MSARRQLLGVLAVGCLICAVARPQERISADAVKAAYLYRITSFVQWPGTRRPDAPFTIDVLGDPGIAADLAQLLPDHMVHGQPARMRVISRISDLGDAQMLYIGPDFGGSIRAAIAAVGDRPVLIVTDEEQGLADGSTINFVEGGQHVRFEVSLTAASRAKLNISSQLLSVAARVEGRNLGSEVDCAHGRLMDAADFNCPERVWARWAVREHGSRR